MKGSIFDVRNLRASATTALRNLAASLPPSLADFSFPVSDTLRDPSNATVASQKRAFVSLAASITARICKMTKPDDIQLTALDLSNSPLAPLRNKVGVTIVDNRSGLPVISLVFSRTITNRNRIVPLVVAHQLSGDSTEIKRSFEEEFRRSHGASSRDIARSVMVRAVDRLSKYIRLHPRTAAVVGIAALGLGSLLFKTRLDAKASMDRYQALELISKQADSAGYNWYHYAAQVTKNDFDLLAKRMSSGLPAERIAAAKLFCQLAHNRTLLNSIPGVDDMTTEAFRAYFTTALQTEKEPHVRAALGLYYVAIGLNRPPEYVASMPGYEKQFEFAMSIVK